jgi:hypothetical protein
MNLIEKRKTESKIANFRQYQYDLIPEFFELGISYLRQFGLDVNDDYYDISILPNTNYEGLNYFAIRSVKIITQNPATHEPFGDFVIPELIQGQFFILNSSYYIPSIFLVDEPIVCRKKSITLYSLFNPITIYFENNRVIFMGVNIPINRFFQLVLQDDVDLVSERFGVTLTKEPIDDVIEYFSNKFNLSLDIDEIVSSIEAIIFDDWTLNLYKEFYNIDGDVTLRRIIELSFVNWNSDISFIDLAHKRLTFIEVFLTPFIQSIRTASWYLMTQSDAKFLRIKDNEITKYFFVGVGDDGGGMGTFYDTVNGYTSVLLMKASLKPPGIRGDLPSSVSGIHSSHKGRICPVSVKTKNPGYVVSLVPDQNIDMTYGLFL